MKNNNYVRNNFDSLIWKPIKYLLITVFIVWVLDLLDVPSKLGIINTLTDKYDWFSLLGALGSGLVSVYFLILITRMDREDNNDIMRRAQRPNLNISVFDSKTYFAKTKYGFINEQKEIIEGANFVISILNSGQTAAIIDVINSYIVVDRYDLQVVNKHKSKDGTVAEMKDEIVEEEISLQKFADRISISSNSKIDINITYREMQKSFVVSTSEKPKIKEIYIEYVDLFGFKYKDHTILEGNMYRTIEDNKEL